MARNEQLFVAILRPLYYSLTVEGFDRTEEKGPMFWKKSGKAV